MDTDKWTRWTLRDMFKIDFCFLWRRIIGHFFVPKIDIHGVLIHYEIRGKGSETIVFAHGLLWSEKIFENQVNALQDRYRCLSFDFRGQGQTAVTRSGYDLETLSADTTSLIEALGAAPCHFVGVSM